MNSLIVSIRYCAFWTVVAVLAVSALGQQPPRQLPDPQSQPSRPQDQSVGPPASAQSSRTFQGMIIPSHEGYVLTESSGKSYRLDDQTRVKDFNGQNVEVKGVLDVSSNTIRVESIAPVS